MGVGRAYTLDPPGGRGLQAADTDGWWLPLLVAAEAVFALTMIVFGDVTVDEALMTAAGASALAAAAIYLGPALRQVGARLGLRGPERHGCERRRQVLPRLAVLVKLELTVVGVGELCVGLDTSGALRLAAGITLMSMAICQGQPALLAVGRRIFPPVGPT